MPLLSAEPDVNTIPPDAAGLAALATNQDGPRNRAHVGRHPAAHRDRAASLRAGAGLDRRCSALAVDARASSERGRAAGDSSTFRDAASKEDRPAALRAATGEEFNTAATEARARADVEVARDAVGRAARGYTNRAARISVARRRGHLDRATTAALGRTAPQADAAARTAPRGRAGLEEHRAGGAVDLGAGSDAAGSDAAGSDAAGSDAAGSDAAGSDAAGSDAHGTAVALLRPAAANYELACGLAQGGPDLQK